MFIHNICKYINIDTTKILLCTLVPNQLDYVNSILSWAPATTVKPYQTIQNFAARIVYKKSKREDVCTCLQESHWLPIKYRTIFKLLTVVYNALQGQTPQYPNEKLKQKHFLEPPDNQHHPALLWTFLSTRENHLLTKALVLLWQNTGMTYQNTSERPKTSKNSNTCSKHTLAH